MLDLTYPLSTQTMVTDGRRIRFFAYQLNTLHLWKGNEANPLRNICWASPQMELYEKVEDGEVIGFNEEALRVILQFYLNKPVDRGLELRPYLQEEQAPGKKHLFFNHKGDKPLHVPVIGRFQYPKHAVYF